MTKPPQSVVLRLIGRAVVGFFVVLVVAMQIAPSISAQALPAAEAAPISTGFALPRTAGTLQYAVSASESLSWGYYGNQGSAKSTNLTGDVAYISNSKRDPFSMIFSGGRSWATSEQPSYTYLNLALSQVVSAGRWNFVLSDSVGYLPGTPTTGLSGVAGVGDLGVAPVQVGGDTGQGVLTNYSSRVTNTASGSLQRPLTGKTSINASGSYSMMSFLGSAGSVSQGLDNDSRTGTAGLSHQFDARNTLGGNFMYTSFGYSGNGMATLPDVTSQTASAQFSHSFTRKLRLSAAGGPQWTSFGLAGSTPSVSLFADITGSYTGQFSHASLGYVRSTNTGFGVVGGALSSGVTFAAGRTFARVWNCAVTAAYTQTANLPSPAVASFSFHTTVAGVQLSRAIARNLSGFAAFTLENQSSASANNAVDVFNGLSQFASFGLTFSPSSVHFGRQ
jgi:hypothetical protein